MSVRELVRQLSFSFGFYPISKFVTTYALEVKEIDPFFPNSADESSFSCASVTGSIPSGQHA